MKQNIFAVRLSLVQQQPQSLAGIRIVLVEPAGPLNVGSVARVMKNLGLSQLVLVKPHCDHSDPDAQKMAVHAGDLLASAQVVESLPEALVGCQRAIATTGRSRHDLIPLESPRQALPWLLSPPPDPIPTALIFGPEDRGLSNAELIYAQRCIRIPTNPDYPSLNLAQAVAICGYELSQLADAFPEETASETVWGLPRLRSPLAPLEALEAYYQHLEQFLLRIGYLYPHTVTSRMEKFRQLFARAGLSAPEVAMLRGILRQVEWWLDRDSARSP